MKLKVDDMVIQSALVMSQTRKDWIYLEKLDPKLIKKAFTVISIDLEENTVSIKAIDPKKRSFDNFPIDQLVIIKKEKFILDPNMIG